ncbi:MAG: carbon monoxide dehydrogenase [Burkholderiales bacterium]|nr:carbon monoxide dehydrogenase [Burkholderiales bacterium]
MFEVHEEIQVPYPPRLVWSLLSDPATVVDCVPGAELIEDRGDGTYDGAMSVQFGPIKVTFTADVSLALDHAAMSGGVNARGKDKQVTTRFRSTLKFKVNEHTEASSAIIPVSAHVEVSGRLASIVETGAKVVVKRLVNAFSERLAQRCAMADKFQAGDAAQRG